MYCYQERKGAGTMYLIMNSCMYTTGLMQTQAAALVCSHGTQSGIIGNGSAPDMDN